MISYEYKKVRNVYYLMNTSTESTDYKIVVNNKDKKYEMYRVGPTWSDDAKEDACAAIEDHGNGVLLAGIDSEIGYNEFMEWHLLFKFVYSYDKTMGDKYIIL